ncbi:hypothetical protein PIB30_100497 [Stylosanthes scabra]|uniref:Putative plant transposon protein domain-containing protein n=1 Tax=Stylosanthes scabra TaxID=79078 RepID=A0ABU6ZVS4_9FABA|nr:hypothetical protein [Stylosanthes scabra]
MLVQPSKLHKQLANSAELHVQPLSGAHATNSTCIQGDHATHWCVRSEMCCSSTISAPPDVACATPMLQIRLYETPAHAERGKILEVRKALHERTIKFPEGKDTFEERILARGWGFMYEPSIPINLSWVREFYANKTKKDQREIFMRGRKITCSVSTIEKTLGIPKFRGKCGYSEISEAYNNETLNMDEVLRVIGKEGVTWWKNSHNPVIPSRPKKKILNYEAWMWLKLVYFPYGKWREDDEEVAPPVPPPAAPVDVPTPSAPSSPEPSKKELMRVLRRNERIMRKNEQLMLMMHPGLDTSRLEQISSPDISQNPQGQMVGSAEKENAEEDDDFQSTEATADATTFAGEESADDE